MPSGMRFLPADAVLVRFYLRQKLIVGSLPQGFQKLFLDVALYQHNPQDLEDQEDWYFFTPRSRKYLNRQRPERTVATSLEKTLVVENNDEVIGFERVLDFYAGKTF
ncbi:NAC transcription factor 47 [Sesamum angolense]|uniref:NAC transcription factor 47 n=1 Tax=Sesamum angolense TaxID=2727404 RepID=A0AAE1WQF9_9LAMI|nr:NAC transcription factor 47 [Sesamum angolense]